MSENAINVRIAAGAPKPSAHDELVIGVGIAEQSSRSLPPGPSALQTTLLIARVTFREAARRRILWIAMLAGIDFWLSSGPRFIS